MKAESENCQANKTGKIYPAIKHFDTTSERKEPNRNAKWIRQPF